MTAVPKISIVTFSFNQGRFLEKTILSVFEQGYPNLEYFIIDGGSTDSSVEITKKYDKHLGYWERNADQEQSCCVNKGFARATGELLAWNNAGDGYTQGSFFTVADAFQANPEVAAIVGGGLLVDETGGVISPEEPSAISIELLVRRSELFFCQPSYFFTRSAWKKCGSLDKELESVMDLGFWLRMAKRYVFARLEQILVMTLVASATKTRALSRLLQLEAAMVLCAVAARTGAKIRARSERVANRGAEYSPGGTSRSDEVAGNRSAVQVLTTSV